MPAYTKAFRESDFYEHTIVEKADAVNTNKVGTLRLKPVSILWQPKGSRQFYRVTLEEFDTFMRNRGTRVSK